MEMALMALFSPALIAGILVTYYCTDQDLIIYILKGTQILCQNEEHKSHRDSGMRYPLPFRVQWTELLCSVQSRTFYFQEYGAIRGPGFWPQRRNCRHSFCDLLARHCTLPPKLFCSHGFLLTGPENTLFCSPSTILLTFYCYAKTTAVYNCS